MSHLSIAFLLLAALTLMLVQVAAGSNHEQDSRVRRVSTHWWGLGKRAKNFKHWWGIKKRARNANKEKEAARELPDYWGALLRAIQKRAAAVATNSVDERGSSEDEAGGEYASLEEVNRVARILHELLERNPCSGSLLLQ